MLSGVGKGGVSAFRWWLCFPWIFGGLKLVLWRCCGGAALFSDLLMLELLERVFCIIGVRVMFAAGSSQYAVAFSLPALP